MAGAHPPAGEPGLSLTRVAARLTTPSVYLAVLGGLQLAVLWMLRAHLGTALPVIGSAGLLAMLALVALKRGSEWLRFWGVAALGAFTAIGPTLAAIIERPRIGLTMEHDGMLQVESAIDRVLGGQAIYGVDWSGTPMARLPWDLTSGGNPALHHMAYFPLTVLVGIPFRLLSGTLGLGFDYRIVLIAFALLGLFAIATLPVAAERRLMVLAAIYVSPLITLYLWSGRNDIEFLATVLLSLMLLSRGHTIPAAGALGVAVALKPFAWLAVPFLLVVLVMRLRAGRSRRELLGALAVLVITPIATIVPFFIANPPAFWSDVVLYTSGGVPDAYPIAGYGFGEILYQARLIAHRTDAFPFTAFQLAAMLPVLWWAGRAVARRPTAGRWMAGYAGVLLAFMFFGRFFNDNYVAVVITLFLCVLPLGAASLMPPRAAQAGRLAA